MKEWIEVTQGLPKENRYVIVFKDDDEPMVTFGFLCIDSYGSHFLDKNLRLIPNVTHWMPLPDPPDLLEEK